MSTIISANVSDGTLSIPTTFVTNGSAKMWVNFNGTGTIAARDSFNVSSLTDNGTGDYAVNFSSAMVNDDFSMVGTSCFTGSDTWVQNAQDQTVSFADVHVTRGGSLNDASIISINVHGDLA
jgi:hypothetical protein